MAWTPKRLVGIRMRQWVAFYLQRYSKITGWSQGEIVEFALSKYLPKSFLLDPSMNEELLRYAKEHGYQGGDPMAPLTEEELEMVAKLTPSAPKVKRKGGD